MSSHSSTKIDQKAYLKKYLSGDKSKKKKKEKKRKKEIGAAKVKIIDDDASGYPAQAEIDEELLLGGEDAPQIVGEYIEERPNGTAGTSKWRSIAVKEEQHSDDGDARVKVKHEVEDDRWGRSAVDVRVKNELSPPRKKLSVQRQATPDASPPRRKKRDKSPQRRRRQRSSSADNSPQRNSRHSSPADRHSARASVEQSSPTRKRKQSKSSKKKTSRSPSSDHSPPRKSRQSPGSSSRKVNRRSPSPAQRSNARVSKRSPARRNNHTVAARSSSSDQSPPRQSRRSPARSKNHSASVDQSPPKKGKRAAGKNSRRSSSSDQSPVRKRAYNCSARENQRSGNTDQSPPHRSKRDASSDQSPPRRGDVERNRKRSISPAKRRRKNLSDQSPPRRGRKNSSDQSPARRRRQDCSDQSPQRRTESHRSYKSSLSPARIKREKRSPDQSPPRRATAVKQERASSPPRHSRWEQPSRRQFSESPPPTHKPKPGKTLDGKKAGLQDAKSLQVETDERRRRENRMYAKMPKDISGRDAEVQVRSTGRRGKRAREAAAEDPEEQRQREEQERRTKEKYERWGKGLKQVEDHRERLATEAYESSKPLARYANDEDLDKYLREQERADDPMLEYMRKKRKEQLQDSDAPVKPKYEGAYPENRFGIRPGYRWDGVDRSNGFEQKWFAKQNERRAMREEAYKYSVEDM